jgi:hypothetical protein
MTANRLASKAIVPSAKFGGAAILAATNLTLLPEMLFAYRLSMMQELPPRHWKDSQSKNHK